MAKTAQKQREPEGARTAFVVEAGHAHVEAGHRWRQWNWRLCKEAECKARQAEFNRRFEKQA